MGSTPWLLLPAWMMFLTARRDWGQKIPLCPWQGAQGGPGVPRGEGLALTIALRRVKAKKGVNLLSTKSRSGQWLVSSELLTGGKHSTATVDVARADGAGPR